MRQFRQGSPPKKHRQHHVWQHYLHAWCINRQLYCLMSGRIFPTGTTVIAVENDFYKVGRLTADDVTLIRALFINFEGTHPQTRQNHEAFLKMIIVPAALEGRSSELDDLIETHRTNALEDYHASIEKSFMVSLEDALRGDISFYTDDASCISFVHYLASQYMRTKGIKAGTIKALQKQCGLDVSRTWSVMSQMFATNIGLSIYLERKNRKLILVENETGVEFVTSDQPVINLHGGSKRPPSTLSWYYPISPQLALYLPEVDEEPTFSTATLTSEQVGGLNARIVAASHSQVFARSPNSLQADVSRASG